MASDETMRMGDRAPHLRGITRLPLRVAVAVAVVCAGCGAAAATGAQVKAPPAAPAARTAPTPAHALIGAFHFSTSDFRIDSNAPTELVMATTVLHPGKSSGWHTHPGPAFVIVTGGTVTRYQAGADGACTSATYTAGQGFVEAPGVVHIARDEGSTDVTLQTTFLDVAPGTAAYKSPATAPAGCPGIR